MKMTKKMLPVVLLLVSVFAFSCGVAAEPVAVTPVTAVVNVDAQLGNTFLVAPLTVKVAADTAENYGYTDAVSPTASVSALDVLVALHQYKYADFSKATAADYLEVSDTGWVNKIWNGVKGSPCYTVNGKNDVNPVSGYSYLLNEAPVKNGDTVEFFQCLDAVNYADECAWFMQGTEKLNQIRVEAGKEIELTVKSYTFMWYSAAADLENYQNPAAGLKLALWQDGKPVDLSDKDGKALTTDENGKVKVTFPAKGNYTVIAYNTDETKYFSLPILKVTVYTAVPYSAFKDLKQGAWYESYVSAVLEKGYLQGTSADTFAPEMKLNRGMFAEILYRVAGCPAVAVTNPFTDVTAKAYYYNAVNWANATGITNGVTTTSFAPDVAISREQMAVMIDRYLTVAGVAPAAIDKAEPFADDAEISDYAKDGVYRMVKAGILQGKGQHKFCPRDTATRAEIATVMARLTAE